MADERDDFDEPQMTDWLRRALSRLPRARPERPFSSLTRCRACGAARMCPVSWAEGRDGWWLRLRCGECGACREVVIDAVEAERYEVDLEIAAEEIAESLARFEHAAMLAEARCWVKALELDLVDAADFEVGRRVR